MFDLSRRSFLGTTASSLVPPTLLRAGSAKADRPDAAFFLVGDTHFLANLTVPDKLDARSAATNARLIDHLNRLPGTAIPESAGGGTVAAPRGVLHAGDLIDTGDKNGANATKMQRTELEAYAAEFGLTGKDGRLKVPVYEVHGNHDSPPGDGLAVKKIIERNRNRPDVGNVSKNGLHYSWDWGGVHLVALGIVVGEVKSVTRKRRYNPLGSLDFLLDDLKEKVGASGRPVVLLHHVDVARYSTPPDPAAPASGKEWDPADVRGYHEALRAYNVAAVLYGHTHARNIFRWDGTPKRGPAGIPVFNVDNSGHFNSKTQGLFHFHIAGDRLTVREYVTDDSWQTGKWTPQSWNFPLGERKD